MPLLARRGIILTTALTARPNTKRTALKLLALAGLGLAVPKPVAAAEAIRWYKPVLGWRVMGHPTNVSKAQFESMCAIAFSRWHMATGLRFEFSGADITFHMSNQLPEWTSARAEMPSPRGETRTCNIWLNSNFTHTLNDDERKAPYSCDLAYELAHEIGHTLGFAHTHRAPSIMRPSLEYPFAVGLDDEDIAEAGRRYGLAVSDKPVTNLFLAGVFK